MRDSQASTVVSVVVCTRQRGPAVADTVRSVLRSDYRSFQMHVIDQSSSDDTEAALTPWRADPRLNYLRSATSGLANARNIGIARAGSGIIALTDDDCVVAEDWIEQVVAAFSTDKRIGLVFGNVEPGPHDAAAGFITGYLRHEPVTVRGISGKARAEGIGACMAIRYEVWRSLGGFDPMLGAGAQFHSADDTDFAIRALDAGYLIHETPRVRVKHNGFRTWAQGDTLLHGYLFGIGAALAKQLKLGHLSVLYLFGALAIRFLFGRPVVEFGFVPPMQLRLAGFLGGVKAGLLAPLDRRRGMFGAPMRNTRLRDAVGIDV